MYFNMAALRTVDVSTILVARACCPLFVCVLEYLFLGRQLPSARSTLALCVLASSATGYMLTAKHENTVPDLHAWALLSCYFVTISAADTFGKWIVSGLQWRSHWGPVLYSNSLSIPHQLSVGIATGELSALRGVTWSAAHVGILALTCVLGVSISYFAWGARSAVSATSFTLLGIANKLLSVLGGALGPQRLGSRRPSSL